MFEAVDPRDSPPSSTQGDIFKTVAICAAALRQLSRAVMM